jgi:hypothetical protein
VEATDVGHVGDGLLVARQHAERWPLSERAMRAVPVVGP